MSKAVLIAIRHEWCEKIAELKKKYDFRKTCPNIPTPYKCYIYEPKGKRRYYSQPLPIPYCEGTGKIIGEFVCDRVETLARVGFSGSREEPKYCVYNPLSMSAKPIDGILDDGCLSLPELETYLAGAVGCAWHISDLKMYDTPKELADFTPSCNYGDGGECVRPGECECYFQRADYNQDGSVNIVQCTKRVTRPPQSWRYVEEQT